MDKKEFLENLEYYIEFLLFDRDEIFGNDMISQFHIYREEIDKGLKIHKISSEKNVVLKEADNAYMRDVKKILPLWEQDGIYFLRKKYKDEITKEMWYWWIDEIVKGEYPMELIPKHLINEIEKFYKKK